MTVGTTPSPRGLDVILVAPNVSELMGGEAIKALQIYLELERQGVSVHQVTHVRVKNELDKNFPDMKVTYVQDTMLAKTFHRFKLSETFLNMAFLNTATKKVQEILKTEPGALVHFTSPISPVLPFPALPTAPVVIGPINGNIHYPPTFRNREPLSYKIRRWLHPAMQFFHRLSSSGKRQAQALLVAGGERTYESLRIAGCRNEQFVDSIDSGVVNRLLDTPRITHVGTNFKFYHNGRLVEHKGTDLIVKSLLKTKYPIELDIIGSGPELEKLKSLVRSLSLEKRVTFTGWIPHPKVAEMLRQYRAFVFPSLAEANGIVVQEAMMQGLPVIALNWGGPSLLVTPETGVLIEPVSEEQVINELAASMDRLAEDGELAEQMSINARERALSEGYVWSGVILDWRQVYEKVLSRTKIPSRV